MEVNPLPLTVGLLLLLVTAYGILRARRYYGLADSPTRRFITGLEVALVLFGFAGGTTMILMAFLGEGLFLLVELVLITGFLFLVALSIRYLEEETQGIYGKKLTGETGIKKSDVFLVETTEEAKLLLKALERENVPIFVISRRPKDDWTRKFGINPEKFLWLSGVPHKHAVNPSSLHILREESVKFMRNHDRSAIYIEGIEYLMFYVESNAIAKFLFTLRDYALVNGAYMIVLASPSILDKKQFTILAKEFKKPDIEEVKEILSSKAFFGSITREDMDKLIGKTKVKSRKSEEQTGEGNASDSDSKEGSRSG